MLLIGGLEVFDDPRCGKGLKKILSMPFSREKTLFCAITQESALVALEDRLISTYNGIKIQTIFYRDIVSVNSYDVFLERGINIHGLNFGEKITLSSKEEMKTIAPYVQRLLDLVAEAKAKTASVSGNKSDSADYMVSQLERLAALHRDKHLTDEEFEAAKAKLLR